MGAQVVLRMRRVVSTPGIPPCEAGYVPELAEPNARQLAQRKQANRRSSNPARPSSAPRLSSKPRTPPLATANAADVGFAQGDVPRAAAAIAQKLAAPEMIPTLQGWIADRAAFASARERNAFDAGMAHGLRAVKGALSASAPALATDTNPKMRSR